MLIRWQMLRLALTLCVFSQMKDIKHKLSNSKFLLSPGSCPRSETFGCWGAQSVIAFFWTWPCGISNWREWRIEQNASKSFTGGSNWWPSVRSKGEKILDLIIKSISKFYTKLCVCSTYRIEFSFCRLGPVSGYRLEVLGSKTLTWGFEMTPHQLHVLVSFTVSSIKIFTSNCH